MHGAAAESTQAPCPANPDGKTSSMIYGKRRGRVPVAMACLLAAALSIQSTAVVASIVNIESQRGESEEGLSGRYHLSLSGAKGNTDKLGLTTSVRLESKHETITDLMIAEYAYGESNNRRDTNRAFAHLRRTAQTREKIAPEAFLQAERNEFTRIAFRGLIGGGLRLTVNDTPQMRNHIGIGAYFSREKYDRRPDVSDSGTHHLWRLSSYLSLNGDLNDYARAYNTLYYQPAPRQVSNFRLLNESGLLVRLTERLDLKVALRLIHQSHPPQRVEKTDGNLVTGAEYRF